MSDVKLYKKDMVAQHGNLDSNVNQSCETSYSGGYAFSQKSEITVLYESHCDEQFDHEILR